MNIMQGWKCHSKFSPSWTALCFHFAVLQSKYQEVLKKLNLTVNKYIDCRFLLLFCWTCGVFAAIISSVTCLSSAQGQTAAGLLPIPSTGIFNYFQPFAILAKSFRQRPWMNHFPPANTDKEAETIMLGCNYIAPVPKLSFLLYQAIYGVLFYLVFQKQQQKQQRTIKQLPLKFAPHLSPQHKV